MDAGNACLSAGPGACRRPFARNETADGMGFMATKLSDLKIKLFTDGADKA